MNSKKILAITVTAIFLTTSSLASAAEESFIIFHGNTASIKAETAPKKVVKKPVKPAKKVVKKAVKKLPKKIQKTPTKIPTTSTPKTSSPASKTPEAVTNITPKTTEVHPSKLSPATHSVAIENFAFLPVELKIKVGDKVTFTQKDTTQHTVDTDPHPNHTQLPGFDSGLLSQGQSYSFTFTKAGTFTYHCSPHPSMKGKIIVEE